MMEHKLAQTVIKPYIQEPTPGDSKVLVLMRQLLDEMGKSKTVRFDEKSRYQQIEITEMEKLLAFHLIYVED
jgi:hypothetical protein